MLNKNTKGSYLLDILKKSPGHLYWKDRAGIYQGSNDAQAIFLGYKSGEDLIGKTDFDLLWKNKAHFLQAIDKQVMKTKKEYSVEEIVYDHSGKETIFFSQKLPLYDPNTKEVIGIIGTSLDITKQKQSHIAKQVFLKNIAHDIRTPLAGIIGLAQLQKMGLASLKEAKEFGQMAYSAGNQLLELLNAVIKTIDTEHMADPVKSETFDLAEFARDLYALMESSIYTKGLKFKLDIDKDLPLVVIDRIKLKRILINLLSNAVKFTKEGEISLAIKQLGIENNHANIDMRVSDTGIGIAKENLSKIFDRFYRAYPSYLVEYSGYGLGLYLVKETLNLLGGTIDVSSEEEKGTCFTLNFKFLLADKLSEKTDTVVPSSEAQSSNKASFVLIAEDNAIVLRVVKNLLEKAGYEVIATVDGKAALEALQSHSFTWALLDIGLPKLKGTETCKQYRQWEKENNKPRLPIFALTGHSVDEVEGECRESSIDQIFTKPLTDKIIQEIKAFVNKK